MYRISFAVVLWMAAALTLMAEPMHWSLCKRSQPEVPRFESEADRAWLRNDVDAFILAQLLKEGLRPAPEADRRTLLRRLSFDLTGLPPTVAEIAAFENDASADAYEKLVDQLLTSPHYGERWGRHWLDLVRYAETEGFEYDRQRPGAWRYRDYVIQSFNDDKPYDRFIQEQLAGDEIDPDNRTMQVAAGFHRLGPVRRNLGNPDVAFSRNEVLTEMTDIVGTVFLGMTMGCARCHDHKFDDIPQKDYYRLQAFLAATHEHDISLASAEARAEWKARADKVVKEIKNIQSALKDLDGEDKERMQERLHETQRSMPTPLPTISSVRNVADQRTPIHVLKRGDADKEAEAVGMRLPGALLAKDPSELPADTNNPKTILARWLTEPEHPLTARVMVNRVWQNHFGTGLVETPNDFGHNGGLPSHPELLDYLANEFVANGWRRKPLHRLILLSSTYRQASFTQDGKLGTGKDPENRLLWHFPRRRLDAEEIRDAMLAISGKLNRKAGGPSVVLPVDPDLMKLLYDSSQWAVTPDEEEHNRRTVYLLAKRNLRLPFAEVFDQPDAQTSCARRERSTHAPQALEMLNGKTANRLAQAFAERLEREAGEDHGKQVELAYLLAVGRTPTEKEKELAIRFVAKQPLKEFALAVFNINAFLYVE